MWAWKRKQMRMEQRVRFGVCVSCGRSVGIRQTSCPYCAEWVYLPRWFRWGRAVVCAGVLLLALWVLLRDPELFMASIAVFRGFPAYLVAAGALALFFPEPFEREVIVSLREQIRCVLRALGLSLLLLLAGLAGGWLWTQPDATGHECALSFLLLAGSVLGALAYGVSLARFVGLVCIVSAWLLA